MRFGTVRQCNVVNFETLGNAKKQAEGAPDVLRVVLVLEEGEGYSGVVSVVEGKPQITVDGVRNGTLTTKIDGKRVLILDPVYVNELEVVSEEGKNE